MSTFTIATHNLDFGRAHDSHERDVARIITGNTDQGPVKLLTLQELTEQLTIPGVKVWQPKDGKRTGSEAIVVDADVQILRRFARRAADDNLGQRIGWRNHAAVLVDPPEFPKPVLVIDTHFPPRRMRNVPLYAAYTVTLLWMIAKARRNGWEWVVIGDANRKGRENPFGILGRRGRRLGRRWFGVGIDGAVVSPGLARRVSHVTPWYPPNRRDGHPVVYMTLHAKPLR